MVKPRRWSPERQHSQLLGTCLLETWVETPTPKLPEQKLSERGQAPVFRRTLSGDSEEPRLEFLICYDYVCVCAQQGRGCTCHSMHMEAGCQCCELSYLSTSRWALGIKPRLAGLCPAVWMRNVSCSSAGGAVWQRYGNFRRCSLLKEACHGRWPSRVYSLAYSMLSFLFLMALHFCFSHLPSLMDCISAWK